MLNYAEVIPDLVFITITTVPPDLHYSNVDIKSFNDNNATYDGSQVGLLYNVN